jgi:glucose-6-phosphate isomerase
MNPQHEALRKFGYQINFAVENFSNHGLAANQFSNILIGGLGGSGIGGRIVSDRNFWLVSQANRVWIRTQRQALEHARRDGSVGAK